MRIITPDQFNHEWNTVMYSSHGSIAPESVMKLAFEDLEGGKCEVRQNALHPRGGGCPTLKNVQHNRNCHNFLMLFWTCLQCPIGTVLARVPYW